MISQDSTFNIDLGANWSPTLETRKGHKIIKHGVYARIRHSMYSAIWLFSIAQALLLNNWLAGWGVVLAFALMYFLRTPNEEQIMIGHFGIAYKDYMAETGRLFYTTRPDGLGLGLSISRTIIDAHDGRLTAFANADEGLTFRFILPTQ